QLKTSDHQVGGCLRAEDAGNPEPGVSFFFSSRRRHTRSKRDWSSDVCSSDLAFATSECDSSCAKTEAKNKRAAKTAITQFSVIRSEERRVGKECRSRWSADN